MAKPPFSTMPLPHDAPDWFKGHIWGNIQRGWQFENNAGALWANPITTINAFNRVTGGNGSLAQPFTGWDTNINWAAGSQIVQISSVGGNANTYYAFSAPISVTGQRTWIIGDGKAKTTLLWTGGAGVAFTFSNGASEYNYGGMSMLNFAATDTANTKTFCKLIDCGQMTFDFIDCVQNTWKGSSNSIGFDVRGREFLTWDRNVIFADIALQINPNPNVPSICFDHSGFYRSQLAANVNNAGYSVQIANQVAMSNSSFVHCAFVLGGFSWIDTTGNFANGSYGLDMNGCRFEQNDVATALLDIELTSAVGSGNPLYQAAFRNINFYGTGGVTSGIKFRGVKLFTLDSLNYALASGVAADLDSSDGPATIIGGRRAVGSTVTLGAGFNYVAVGSNFLNPNFQESIAGKIQTVGTAPSVSSTGLGGGAATMETGSNDTAGTIILTAAGVPANNGQITLTFNVAYTGNLPVMVCQVALGSAGWTSGAWLEVVPSLSAPVIAWTNNGVALAAGSSYKVHYWVVGK